ncbi:nuclear transport factor 2 family protein [Streptomyces sp. NPDC004732]|uniref:nuclear transport factor 2 family protein n=1 Tax=Streptomyces sp. NPDC004732 TaxID=3154290 RepID=UPI0033B00C07
MLTHRTNRTALLMAAGTAALALTASACSSDGDGKSGDDNGRTAADRAPKGVVTEAGAKEIVDNYVKVNNRANAKRDSHILSAVEGGGLFETSANGYKQDKLQSAKDRADGRKPFEYVNREYVIPSAKSGVTWFALRADTKGANGTSDKTSRATVVFDKVDGDWKAVWSGWTTKKDPKTPALAKDSDGFAVPVTDTGKKQGILAPDQMDDALVALYATDEKLGNKVGASETAKWMTQFPLEQNKMLNPGGKSEFKAGKTDHKKVYALRTEKGGTLTFFNADVQEYMHTTDPAALITPSPQIAFLVGSKKDERVFLVDYLHQGSAYIPAKGTVSMVTDSWDMIKAEGPRRGLR